MLLEALTAPRVYHESQRNRTYNQSMIPNSVTRAPNRNHEADVPQRIAFVCHYNITG